MKPKRLPKHGTLRNLHQPFALKSKGTSLPFNVYGRKKAVLGSLYGLRLASFLGNGHQPVKTIIFHVKSSDADRDVFPTGIIPDPVTERKVLCLIMA